MTTFTQLDHDIPASLPHASIPKAAINPLFGLRRGARADPFHFFVETAKSHDIIEFPNPQGRFFLLNHPDYVERVLQTNYRNYPKSAYYRRVEPIFGKGLFELEGTAWRQKRQTVQPAFHMEQIEALVAVMTKEIEGLLDAWQGLAERRASIDIVTPLMGMAINIITRALCHAPLPGDMREVTSALTTMMREGERILWSLLPSLHGLPSPRKFRLNRAIRTFDAALFALIRERRESDERHNDLLDMLLDSHAVETGGAIGDKELRDDLMTMLIAGHETTAVAIAWAAYLMSKNPQVWRKLTDEIDRVLGERAPTFADLRQLPYTGMVMQEVLRFYPPFWTISRRCLEADTLGPYGIPAGSTVMLCPYVTHRNPKLWDNPEGFDPERFLEERSAHRHKFAYFPFGGGPRICLGRQLALVEAQIYLAMLAQRYTLELVPGQKIEPEPTISLRPRHGIHMAIKPRNPPVQRSHAA